MGTYPGGGRHGKNTLFPINPGGVLLALKEVFTNISPGNHPVFMGIS
jgi:hypothetical protein